MKSLLKSGRLFIPALFAAALSAAGAPASMQTVLLAGGASAGVTQYLVALPHIAYGGPWRTQIIVTNTSSIQASLTLYFYGDDGSALNVPFSGVSSTSTTLTVPANGQTTVEPDYSGTSTVAGWAGLVYTNSGLKIQGVFLWHDPADVPGKYTEAAAPIVSQGAAACIIPLPSTAAYTMPFDETSGRFSGYGFANTTNAAVTVSLTFYDATGSQLGQYSQQLNAFGHTQILTKDKVPAAANQKGTMVIGGTGIVPLGFRFTQYYTFTTWQP